MKSPFPLFVFTYRDTRQNGKRKAILQYLKQLSISNPNIEVHYVKCDGTTQILNIKEFIDNWKEVVK